MHILLVAIHNSGMITTYRTNLYFTNNKIKPEGGAVVPLVVDVCPVVGRVVVSSPLVVVNGAVVLVVFVVVTTIIIACIKICY